MIPKQRRDYMGKRVLLILNPQAGKGSAKNKLFEIVDQLCAHRFEVCVHTTQYGGHCGELVKEYAKDYDLLMSCGGDGTLNETINAMMKYHIQIPLGFIPMGTVNDFASTLHIPKSVKDAVQLITDGMIYHSDIGHFNDGYFAYVAAFGLFTDISYSTPQQYKNILGRMAYFLEGVKKLPKIKTYHISIHYDGQAIEDDYIFGAISNSRFIGGMQAYNTKHAQLDDGKFEVLLIRCPQNPLDIQVIISALLRQDLNEKFMTFFTASSISMISSEEIAWTLDGESGGSHHAVQINNQPLALSIFVPKDLND